MTNVEKTKKNKTFYQVLGIIGDIILIPVILIALISSSAMFVARSQNTLPSIFGLTLVFVASESMEPSGFMKGDVLFLTKCDPYTLKVGTPNDIEDELGDVIAFYSYSNLTSLNNGSLKNQSIKWSYLKRFLVLYICNFWLHNI